jgi:uncharacterized protein DUF3291
VATVGRVPTYHLAQVNVGRPLEPLTSPRLADFVNQLDEVNAIADGAPGFVWRLRTEDNNATAIQVFDDDGLIVNMSVWETVESLADYVFRDRDHLAVLRRRRDWFAVPTEAMTALWWVPAGHTPTVAEAEDRIRHLREHGPSPYSFVFRTLFPAPGQDATRSEDDWFCPIG